MVERMSQKGEKARWAEKSRGGKKQYKKMFLVQYREREKEELTGNAKSNPPMGVVERGQNFL
jgi:hypothetical protein